jgi:hypothetical protein
VQRDDRGRASAGGLQDGAGFFAPRAAGAGGVSKRHARRPVGGERPLVGSLPGSCPSGPHQSRPREQPECPRGAGPHHRVPSQLGHRQGRFVPQRERPRRGPLSGDPGHRLRPCVRQREGGSHRRIRSGSLGAGGSVQRGRAAGVPRDGRGLQERDDQSSQRHRGGLSRAARPGRPHRDRRVDSRDPATVPGSPLVSRRGWSGADCGCGSGGDQPGRDRSDDADAHTGARPDRERAEPAGGTATRRCGERDQPGRAGLPACRPNSSGADPT